MRKKIPLFANIRKRYGLRLDKAAKLFGVTTRTVRNWEKRQAPAPVMAWLRLAYERDLGAIHPDWVKFHIGLNGKLYGPNGLITDADHLRRWKECTRYSEWPES